ncbi:MAG: hypothetical protein EP349_10790 [Alphaproteobacteria bacterium]|nr:MAG: hypothetical protein EP349_10790 [Alphaproteobacteria bacterium]
MASDILKAWRENADEVFAAQPEDRRDYDMARVEKVKNMLAETKTGREILKWAEENDIEIRLDYQCEEAGAGGYYVPGSKMVCLNAYLPDDRMMVALAHELRHAWQGENGFCATLYKDAGTYLKQFRFIEADAAAYEMQICAEWKELHPEFELSHFRQMCMDLAEKQKASAPDYLKGKEALWAGFCGFFATGERKNFYDGGSLYTGEILAGLEEWDGTPGTATEYSGGKDHKLPPYEGLNVEDKEQFLRLANSFDGKDNYLKDIPLDILTHEQFIGGLSQRNLDRFLVLHAAEEKERAKGNTTPKPIPRLM